MKRKIIATVLSMIGIFLVGFSTLLILGFFEKQKAGILIEADPVSTVFIDGKEIGRTPYEAEIIPSEIMVKIRPDVKEGQVLDDYETKVNLIPGIKTIIKHDFRENEENSSGVIVSFEKAGNKDSFVTVVSAPDNAQITIDNKVYGYAPLRVSVPGGDYNLSIKAEGYLEKQLPIRVYKGYKLTAFVKLAKKEVQSQEQEAVLSEETKIQERITINKTDVGFLRVRSGASIGFPEVAQVKPEEEYDILETGENEKWYKIKVGEIEGWVSGEFVTKIYIPVTETPEYKTQ